MDNVLKKRFSELSKQADEIEGSKKSEYDAYSERNRINVEPNIVLGWKVKTKNLIGNACGNDSQHFKEFEKEEIGWSSSTLNTFRRMRVVFEAAKEDFEGGYLTSVRTLVQAEVFDSELEQANELLKHGYASAAAVIAGAVLETCLRDLCSKNGIGHGKLDKMNADLTKAGVYNGIVQKRVTHLAAVRNSAAHGNTAEFVTYDVTAMIDEIERFLAQHLI
jgi:hypothetical protein